MGIPRSPPHTQWPPRPTRVEMHTSTQVHALTCTQARANQRSTRPHQTRAQAARLAADVAARGLDEAQGGILLLRAPWLLVEGRERLKTNRDGEPTLESSRRALVLCCFGGEGKGCGVSRADVASGACRVFCWWAGSKCRWQ